MGQIFTISKKNYQFRIELPHLPGPSIVVSICLFEHYVFITARKRSLGQGNIFRSVCQEFCSQRGLSAPGGCLVWRGLFPGGCVSVPGGMPGGDPPGWLLLRVVCILLECILVWFILLSSTKLRKGNVFTPVYDSGQTTPRQTPPMQTAPWADTPPPPGGHTHPWKDTPG